MQRDPRAWLWDVRQAADRLAGFVAGRTAAAYLADAMLRSAVERQLEIIGEALNQLSNAAPDIAVEIPDLRRAIGMRNVLIHGYAKVDDETVWRTATEAVPALRTQVVALLVKLGDRP